jgi:hypothetical protein
MLGAARLTEETRRVVERYDAALQQIAHLKSENRSIKEHLRENEVKVMRLISHYQKDIDDRTNAITRLNDERRAREIYEMNQRRKQFSDKSTEIDDDFNSREAELERIIYLLEDEIQALKENHRIQQEEFDRQALHNQALAKKSFDKNINVLRMMATEAVSTEVADALTELLCNNERLSSEFREVLNEMEQLHMSREALSKELVRTRRELEFMAYREKLITKKLHDEKMKGRDADALSCTEDLLDDAMPSNSLEEYFKESLRLCNT